MLTMAMSQKAYHLRPAVFDSSMGLKKVRGVPSPTASPRHTYPYTLRRCHSRCFSSYSMYLRSGRGERG